MGRDNRLGRNTQLVIIIDCVSSACLCWGLFFPKLCFLFAGHSYSLRICTLTKLLKEVLNWSS